MFVFTNTLINVLVKIFVTFDHSFVNKIKMCILQRKLPIQQSLLESNNSNDDIAKWVYSSLLPFLWDEQIMIKRIKHNQAKNQNISKDFGVKVKMTKTFNLTKNVKQTTVWKLLTITFKKRNMKIYYVKVYTN